MTEKVIDGPMVKSLIDHLMELKPTGILGTYAMSLETRDDLIKALVSLAFQDHEDMIVGDPVMTMRMAPQRVDMLANLSLERMESFVDNGKLREDEDEIDEGILHMFILKALASRADRIVIPIQYEEEVDADTEDKPVQG